MTENRFPPGWDEARVRRVIEHYDNQTDDEAAAEDDERYNASTHVVMEVPKELVPAIRELIARHTRV